jgi:hypothetical protein
MLFRDSWLLYMTNIRFLIAATGRDKTIFRHRMIVQLYPYQMVVTVELGRLWGGFCWRKLPSA